MPDAIFSLAAIVAACLLALAVYALSKRSARRRRNLDTPPAWTPPDTTDPFAAWEDLFDPQSRRY